MLGAVRPRSRTRAVRGFAGGIFIACGSSVISQRNLLPAPDQGTAPTRHQTASAAAAMRAEASRIRNRQRHHGPSDSGWD